MSPAEAVVRLRTYARASAPPDEAEAIGELLDHIARLEQVLDLIDSGVRSAMRDKPDNAILGVKGRR